MSNVTIFALVSCSNKLGFPGTSYFKASTRKCLGSHVTQVMEYSWKWNLNWCYAVAFEGKICRLYASMYCAYKQVSVLLVNIPFREFASTFLSLFLEFQYTKRNNKYDRPSDPHYCILSFLLPLPFRKRNTTSFFEIVSCWYLVLVSYLVRSPRSILGPPLKPSSQFYSDRKADISSSEFHYFNSPIAWKLKLHHMKYFACRFKVVIKFFFSYPCP